MVHNVKQIIKIKDYISNDIIANDAITNFTHNKYIIKQSTGMGGTSSILNIKDKSVLIITPTTGIIKGKELHAQSHHLSIYMGSKDNWNDVSDRLHDGDMIIITVTFDQLVMLKEKNYQLYLKICKINWFVDEFQVFGEAEYRKNASDAFYQIFTDAKVPFILSTATPTHKMIDIPLHIQDSLEVIHIEHTIPKIKNVNVQPMVGYYNFVKQELAQGRKVVIFTNDINKYKNILHSDNYGEQTQILVGEKIAIKTSLIKARTLDEQIKIETGQIDTTKDIYILSTSYTIGYDIDFDCSLAICVDGYNVAECKYLNDIIQAFGRCRNNVYNATIFYSGISEKLIPTRIDVLNAENAIVNTEWTAEYLTQIQPHINTINKSLTFNVNSLIQSLKQANFNVKDMTADADKPKAPKGGLTFSINNIIEQDIEVTQPQVLTILNNIEGDDSEFNGFGVKPLLIHSYGYIAKLTGSQYLLHVPDKMDRCIDKLKSFFDVNDELMTEYKTIEKYKRYHITTKQKEMAIANGAIMDAEFYNKYHHLFIGDEAFRKIKEVVEALYCIKGINDDSLIPLRIQKFIKGFSAISEVLLNAYVDGLTSDTGLDVKKLIKDKDIENLKTIKVDTNHAKHNYFKNVPRTLGTKLNEISNEGLNHGETYQFNSSEINQFNQKLASITKSLCECTNGVYASYMSNVYSINKQKENHNDMILFLLSSSVAGHVAGFKRATIDDREFNIITKTTRQLRSLTPYEMVTFDIDSEFATFVDDMVGSNIKDDVYNNLIREYGICRADAKKKYNSILNSWQAPLTEITKVLTKCGYSIEQIEQLKVIIKSGKGSFYRNMTPREKKAVETFVEVNDIRKYTRVHDAVMFMKSEKTKYITQFGSLRFSSDTKFATESSEKYAVDLAKWIAERTTTK